MFIKGEMRNENQGMSVHTLPKLLHVQRSPLPWQQRQIPLLIDLSCNYQPTV